MEWNTVNEINEVIVYHRKVNKDYLEMLLPVRLRLTVKDIDNIMVYADDEIRDWSGTWIKSIRSGAVFDERYALWEQVARGYELQIENAEDGEFYTLDLQKLCNGLLLYLRSVIQVDQPSIVYVEGQTIRVNANQIKYRDWDTIMQYALFDEVRYEI